MGRLLWLVLGLVLLSISGCSLRERQISFVHPQGYANPHQLASNTDEGWQHKADAASLMAEISADTSTSSPQNPVVQPQVDTTAGLNIRAPYIQLSLAHWVSQEGIHRSARTKKVARHFSLSSLWHRH